MVDLYARIVLRLIGPALALRDKRRAAGIASIASIADAMVIAAGFGLPSSPPSPDAGSQPPAPEVTPPRRPPPIRPVGAQFPGKERETAVYEQLARSAFRSAMQASAPTDSDACRENPGPDLGPQSSSDPRAQLLRPSGTPPSPPPAGGQGGCE